MGGIPWQSKGCYACRKRRVKCDQEQPECKRCIKAGRQCPGYQRERLFIHKSSTAVNESWKTTLVPRVKNASPDESSTPPLSPSSNFSMAPEVQSQFLSFFIDSFAPSSLEQSMVVRGNFMRKLPPRIGRSSLLDQAVMSLCAVFVGNQNADEKVQQHGSKIYAETVQNLRNTINNATHPDEDMLFATVALQMYETVSCSGTGVFGWMAHVQGANALLRRIYGNEDSNSIDDDLFRRLQLVAICEAIMRRKSVFLSGPVWRERMKHESMDQLLTMLSDCSVLLEYIDLIYGDEKLDPTREYSRQLLHYCLSLEKQLLTWYEKLLAGAGRPTTWNGPRFAWMKDGPFNNLLQFSNASFGSAFILCWSALSILYSLIDQFHVLVGRPDDIQVPSIKGVELLRSQSDTEAPREPSELLQAGSEIHRHYRIPTPSASQPQTPTPLQLQSKAKASAQSPFRLPLTPPPPLSPPSPPVARSQLQPDTIPLAFHFANLTARSAAYFLQPEMRALGCQMLLVPLWIANQFYLEHQPGYEAEAKWCYDAFGVLESRGFRFATDLKNSQWADFKDMTMQRITSLLRS